MARERILHPVDYQSGIKTFKNSKNEDMFTSQGFIEFNVTQKMVPKCRVLLFYVRDDQNKETVADNLVIDIEDTFENKVDISVHSRARFCVLLIYCYKRRFATTIFSATQRCNIVATLFRIDTTLFQHCNTANRPV